MLLVSVQHLWKIKNSRISYSTNYPKSPFLETVFLKKVLANPVGVSYQLNEIVIFTGTLRRFHTMAIDYRSITPQNKNFAYYSVSGCHR